MDSCIRVKDRDAVLEISYEDMIKYHGRLNIGGVALAYKALELGLDRLLPGGEIPLRSKISFTSALGDSATGVVDGVEMASRALSRGSLSIDMNCGRGIDAPQNPDGGRFYFEVGYDGRKVGLALKEGLIPQEFTDLLRIAMDRGLKEDEQQRLQEVKEQIASKVMAVKTEDLFNLHYYE